MYAASLARRIQATALHSRMGAALDRMAVRRVAAQPSR